MENLRSILEKVEKCILNSLKEDGICNIYLNNKHYDYKISYYDRTLYVTNNKKEDDHSFVDYFDKYPEDFIKLYEDFIDRWEKELLIVNEKKKQCELSYDTMLRIINKKGVTINGKNIL